MPNHPPRAALFIDFENLYTTLKNLQKQGIDDFGASPAIDFASLVEYVNQHIGGLEMEDTYAAANFSHYNQQLGGLNRLARIIHVDSFEPAPPQTNSKSKAGKKYVVHNYSDMSLAFHAGLHAAKNPASIYVFVTGDGAFAAVANCLQTSGRMVNFILPDPASAHHILLERYLCIPFQDTQPQVPQTENITPPEPDQNTPRKPYQRAVEMISDFRRQFSTAIPADLVKAAIGPASADRILNHARSEEAIDLWQSEAGVACVSLTKERLFGKIQLMEPRPAFARAAGVLYALASLAEAASPPPSRSEWRKALKDRLKISVSEAKQWLNLLLETGILQDSRIKHPDLSTSKLKEFLIRAEAQSPEENPSP